MRFFSNPFKRKPKEQKIKEQEKKTKTKDDKDRWDEPVNTRDFVLVTKTGDYELVPVKVLPDHRLEFKYRGKKIDVRVKPDVPAGILTIPYRKLWTIKKGWQIWDRFLKQLSPKFQYFRIFAVRSEGELTHDPNFDGLKPPMRMRFEELLKLQGKFAKSDAGGVIYEGLKGPKKWYDYIPWIVMGLVVLAFLFSYQVAPNL